MTEHGSRTTHLAVGRDCEAEANIREMSLGGVVRVHLAATKLIDRLAWAVGGGW